MAGYHCLEPLALHRAPALIPGQNTQTCIFLYAVDRGSHCVIYVRRTRCSLLPTYSVAEAFVVVVVVVAGAPLVRILASEHTVSPSTPIHNL